MTMQIYVGTYHKYNSGSIAGKWLEVEDYADKDDFLDACRELHKDEEDPELMFQDHEDIPDCYIDESHVDERLWSEYVDLDEEERTMLMLYRDNTDKDADIETAKERFRGQWDSVEDYAADLVEQIIDMKTLGWLANHIDYGSIARDMQLGGDIDVIHHEGKDWIFDNC